MKNGYRGLITPLYVINIVFQSLLSLLSPIAVMLLFAYLLNTYAGVGTWIYVVLIMLGVFSGLYSMVIFILRAFRALDAIEKGRLEKERSAPGSEGK